MIEKLAGLWETKRWLFWLLLPITAIAVGVKYYLDYLEYKSESDMKETKNIDQQIRFKEQQAKREAKAELKKAKDLQKKIDDRKVEDVDEDWNLKD